jgi:hypothetical protein
MRMETVWSNIHNWLWWKHLARSLLIPRGKSDLRNSLYRALCKSILQENFMVEIRNFQLFELELCSVSDL